MRSKIIFIISILVLALGACSPQPGAITAGSPVPLTSSPTPVISTLTPTFVPTSTNVPLPVPPALPAAASPALVHITFLDANNGWGVASDGSGAVLRSVDGGSTWLNATPSGLTGLGYSTGLTVLDVEHVWVLVPNADYYTGKLYRTSDGGLTWTSFDVPFGGGLLQFVDSSTGRILADRGAGAGSQSVEMFQTSDGGATWLSVYNNDPTRPDSSNTLPLSGIKNGMTFLNANTGWVTGSIPMNGNVYLYNTQDAGVDWAMQTIALPAGYENDMYMAQAPVLFGNDGFLPLAVYLTDTSSLTFYVTHDGGASWSGDPSSATRVIPRCTYAFADALHGWCWDGGASVYYTADGTQTWGKTATTLDLSSNLSQVVFVTGPGDQFTGWALTGPDIAGHSQLYKTTDNGATWIPLIP